MDNKLSILYRQLSIKHRVVVQVYLDGMNLYIGQPRFLFEISRQPGISQVELSANLNLSKETVSVTLRRLEHSGFIVRKQSEGDRRIKLLYLSELGEQILPELQENFARTNQAMFSKLSEIEKNQLEGLLSLMIDGLEKEDNL